MQPTIRKQIKPYLDVPTPRVTMPEEVAGHRKSSFVEVEKGYLDEAARAEARRCLGCRGCLGCGLCAVVCKPAAIDYSLPDEELEIVADEVVITPGTRGVAPDVDARLGLGRFSDVLSSPDFELMLGGSGPFGGVVLRPSDGDVPGRVAFVVCDPLRLKPTDEMRYLSFLQAAGLAAVASRALPPEVDLVVICPPLGEFEKDIAGIDFAGATVHLKRGQTRAVFHAESGPLAVEWQAGEALERAEFDLVVLCSGIEFSSGVRDWARRLGRGSG